MKRHARTAFNQLKQIGCPAHECADYGHFIISAEDNYNHLWADYYDGWNLDGYEFGVCPEITNILQTNGLFCEWINAGMLGVYDV